MIENGLLFSYPGSKYRLGKRFERHYPRHQTYVDVFGGSAALLARKRVSPVEVYNDLDNDVFTTFSVVKDPAGCDGLLQLLAITSNDREQYRACKAILADPNESGIRKAWSFITCGTIGFSAHPAIANGWTRSEKQRRDLPNLPRKIRWWHERLRNVHLWNLPWQEIIDRYDSPHTFFCCDPPYLAGVLRSWAGEYYQHRMDAQAHVELIERLRTIQGYAWISGYSHPLYTQLLFHWRKITFEARETMGGTAGKRQEIAWLNYTDDGSKLENNRLQIARRYIKIMGGEEEAVRYVERVTRLRQLLK
jgi:DNA adenine methylase